MPIAEPPFDIIVVGTGLAGLTAALALSQGQRSIAIAGPMQAELARVDQRTSALFTGALNLLGKLGVLDRCRAGIAPLLGIRIIDDTGRLFRAPETLFRPEEIGLPAFGANLPNGPLAAALADAISATPTIALHETKSVIGLKLGPAAVTVETQEGTRLSGRLLVAADGRNSFVRRDCGIAAQTWSYPQTALACTFAHTRPHEGISNELHRRAGPLTTVPMPGLASSLVWVETKDRARELNALSDQEFSAELEVRLGGILGAIGAIGPRGLFDLAGLKAQAITAARIALIGEAAHALPPIGAQGLNLGLRDIAALADCIEQDPGDCGAPEVLAAYRRARQADIASRLTAVDLLNRSLLSSLLPAQIARSAGLHAIASIGPLRRLLMREGVGPQGELPRLMR